MSSNQFEDAPPVISEEVFNMNLDLFENQDDQLAGNKNITHFLNAAIRVVIVNHVVYSILEIPFELTAALQNVEPEIVEGTFVWSVDVEENGESFNIRLVAQTSGNEVEWTMYVSGTDTETGHLFEDFVLYRAFSTPDTEAGRFEVYYPEDGGSLNVMNGTYENLEGDDYKLSFSVPDGIEEIGGVSATYVEEGDWFSLDLQNPDDSTRALINWNTETLEGSIEASDYNEGNKSCWDDKLRNTVCVIAS